MPVTRAWLFAASRIGASMALSSRVKTSFASVVMSFSGIWCRNRILAGFVTAGLSTLDKPGTAPEHRRTA